MIEAVRRATAVLLAWAQFLGVISPKIRIKKVKIPVATPAPTLPKSFVAKVVARDDADRFTTLLPIRIADSILSLFSMTSRTRSARLFPDFAMVFILISDTVVRAVSEPEKKLDRINNTMSTKSWINMSVDI
jgi:hypothetical protein